MELKLRFGLVLGRLAMLKRKILDDYEQLLRLVSSDFHGQNEIFNFSLHHLEKPAAFVPIEILEKFFCRLFLCQNLVHGVVENTKDKSPSL